MATSVDKGRGPRFLPRNLSRRVSQRDRGGLRGKAQVVLVEHGMERACASSFCSACLLGVAESSEVVQVLCLDASLPPHVPTTASRRFPVPLKRESVFGKGCEEIVKAVQGWVGEEGGGEGGDGMEKGWVVLEGVELMVRKFGVELVVELVGVLRRSGVGGVICVLDKGGIGDVGVLGELRELATTIACPRVNVERKRIIASITDLSPSSGKLTRFEVELSPSLEWLSTRTIQYSPHIAAAAASKETEHSQSTTTPSTTTSTKPPTSTTSTPTPPPTSLPTPTPTPTPPPSWVDDPNARGAAKFAMRHTTTATKPTTPPPLAAPPPKDLIIVEDGDADTDSSDSSHSMDSEDDDDLDL